MADTSNSLKRSHPNDGLQDGENAQKKIRSNNGSPAPLAIKGSTVIKPDVSKIMADARARAAAVAAKLQGSGVGTNGLNRHTQPTSPGALPSGENSTMSRMEQIKARVAATMAKSSTASEQRSPIYQAPAFDDGMSRARGGLGTALHPALMDNAALDARSSKQALLPKHAAALGNRSLAEQKSKVGKGKKQLDISGPSAEETRNNPYFDPSLGGQTATLRARNPKQLKFVEKGKYIAQASALRRQVALEQMRKRIAASTKKASLDEDPSEKHFIVEKPEKDVEWWDEGLLDSYVEIDKGLQLDTKLTSLVQHPVALEPPQDRHAPAPRPLPLTSREQAKLRRQRRMADLKEHQMKVRLGLETPDKPKVKLGNLMRVLGEEAVKDPTAVEARVNREIAERAEKHEEMNETRKLTREQKHEKLEQNKAQDAARGIYLAVFKIDSLANGRHRFKISKNAEQMGGFGLCLMSGRFSLVLFESGEHSMKAYKKLMLNRIDWTENSIAPVREGNKAALASFLENQQDGVLKDLSVNKCQLIFEGQQKEHQFRKWTNRVVETEKEAIEVLERAKLGSMWTLAKSTA